MNRTGAFYPFHPYPFLAAQLKKKGAEKTSERREEAALFSQLGEYPADVEPLSGSVQPVFFGTVNRIHEETGENQGFLQSWIHTGSKNKWFFHKQPCKLAASINRITNTVRNGADSM